MPSNDYRKLLAERGVELHPGKLVDSSGRVLGEHSGTEHFTIGQRKGHGIGGGRVLYVVAVLPESGTVVLGSREECHARSMRITGTNWIGFDPPQGSEFRCLVQVRYHHRAVPCRVMLEDSDAGEARAAVVDFDEPQLAVAPGQGAALYTGDLLLGGGWIASTELASAHAATAGAGLE